LLPNVGVIIGDEVFPLKTYLMKPYSYTQLSFEEKVFNYRLSRDRRVVENAFGILARSFRVWEKLIASDFGTGDKRIRTACLAELKTYLLSTYHEILLMKRTLIEDI
jgi:hypothetical protein